MFDTVIVSGGNIQKDFALRFLEKEIEESGRDNLTFIAADRGLEFFMETGMMPDVAIGDFDSLSSEGKEYIKSHPRLRVQRLKPEKDDSDTQSAMKLAIAGGASRILILGCFGTRLDHVMANIELMVLAEKAGIQLVLMDRHNYMTLASDGMILKRDSRFGRYVSFFPLGTEVTGLTLTGFKYPLEHYTLTAADCGLTVSNEILEDTAEVHFDSGRLLMIMSED